MGKQHYTRHLLKMPIEVWQQEKSKADRPRSPHEGPDDHDPRQITIEEWLGSVGDTPEAEAS